MPYYEGIDYRVVKCTFPNLSADALILSNGDGTYTILLNACFSDDVLYARLQHELKHMAAEHLHRDDMPIWEKEAIANGKTSPTPKAEEWEPFCPNVSLGYEDSMRHALAWADHMMLLHDRGVMPHNDACLR